MYVAGLHSNNNWDLELLSITLDVQRIIKDVVVYDKPNTRNKLVWGLTLNGVFRTSSAYHHITNHSKLERGLTPKKDFKAIWKANIPNKIKHFL